MQSRNAFIIAFFSISFVVALFTIIPLLSQESSWAAWGGVMVGSGVGIWCCWYLSRVISKGKGRDNIRGSANIDLDTNRTTSRWMIPSVVGGMLLARLVSNIFNPGIQSMINNAVAAWIIITFGYAAFVGWRYFPKD